MHQEEFMQIVSYVEIYHNSKNIEYIVDKREEIVKLSYDLGINKTAKFYRTSRNTIKRWRRRYLKSGRVGLYDMSKRPHSSPKKTSSDVIKKIKDLTREKKNKKCCVTSTKIYKTLQLNDDVSYVTCNRYVNEELGKKKNRKKVKTNGGDVSWKKKLKPFERVQVDVKYLTDIPNLKPYFRDNNLAKYEFTFRDVSTGFVIVAYGSEKSVTNNAIFLKNILYLFFKSIPTLDLKTITVQTDNGSENTNRKRHGPYCGENKKSIVTLFVNENFKEHKTIIPGHCTAQSDVESFHWTIERECLGWDDIVDNDSLCYYVDKFLEEYNNRKRWKCDYTPIEKCEEYFGCKIKIPKVVILDNFLENTNFS